MMQLGLALVRGLAVVNAPLSRAGRDLAALLVALMVLLAVAQILSRGLLSYSLDWAEEFARFALVWSVLAIAPFAYRHGGHIAISAFAESLPQRLLALVSLLLNLLVMWVCWRCLQEGLAFWRRGLSLTATTVQMPLAWVYVIVPAAFALLLSVAIELALRVLLYLASGGAVGGLVLNGAVASVARD